MRRAMTVLWVSCALAGCPSTQENTYSRDAARERVDAGADRAVGDDVVDATGDRAVGDGGEVGVEDVAPRDAQESDGTTDGAARDAGADGVAGDAAARDAGDADASGDAGVQMTIEFSSVALVSAPGSGVQMRANLTWHGAFRGSAGGVTFEGEIR